MAVKVHGFDWDNGNRGKCEARVPIADLEALLAGGAYRVFPDGQHSMPNEVRTIAIGRTPAGRYMLVIFTIREKGGRRLMRPISARYMHIKEVKKYEEATQAQE